jgi:hypothetical protein
MEGVYDVANISQRRTMFLEAAGRDIPRQEGRAASGRGRIYDSANSDRQMGSLGWAKISDLHREQKNMEMYGDGSRCDGSRAFLGSYALDDDRCG